MKRNSLMPVCTFDELRVCFVATSQFEETKPIWGKTSASAFATKDYENQLRRGPGENKAILKRNKGFLLMTREIATALRASQ